MKRLYAVAGMMLCIAPLYARTITPDEALQRMGSGVHGAKAPASYTLAETRSDASGAPTVYVFADNAGKQYFLSADDDAEAVLGYLDAPAAGAMPPQLQWWLGEYSRQISAIRQCPSIRKTPRPAAVSRKYIAPMVTSKWGQGNPYNALCPEVGGEISLTGCGATALAQVMNYFEWPEHGTGTGVSTDINGNSYSMDLSTVTFDWANMADTYGDNATDAQKDAVAQLMKACGYAAKMQYAPWWSESYMANLSAALVNNFGYAPTARTCQLSQYGMAEWENMIYENLANTGPVIYRGNSLRQGGHIFVCDGYDANGYFHINWGWSGGYDGFFRFSALNPYMIYTGIDHGGFSEGQWAILGIQRPVEGLSASDAQMTQDNFLSCTVNGSYVTVNGGWYNYSNEVIDVEMGFRIEEYDSNTGFAPTYIPTGSRQINLPVNYGWSSIGADLASLNLPDGLYRLTPVFRRCVTEEGDWREPAHPVNFANYIIFSKNNGVYEIDKRITDKMATVTSFIFPQTIYKERTAKLSITFVNSTDAPVASYYDTRILDNAGNLISRSDGFMIALEPGETVTKDVYIAHTWMSADENGSYQIALADITAGYYRASAYVRLAEDPGLGVLECPAMYLDDRAQSISDRQITVNAELSCTEGLYDSRLELNIYRPDGNSLRYAYGTITPPVVLDNGERTTVKIPVSLPSECMTETELYAVIFGRGAGGYGELARLRFNVDQSGVESVAASNAISIACSAAARTVTAQSDAGVSSIYIIGLDGKAVASISSSGVETALTIDTSDLAKGVYIVTATDRSGQRRTLKTTL